MYSFYRPHNRVHPVIIGPSMTEQKFKDECDIHNILSQFKRTGMIAHIAKHQPEFQHFPENIDYQDNLQIVMDAQYNFSKLPAKLRAEFNNDPGLFLNALHDPANRGRFEDLGILNKRQAPVPPDPGAPSPTAEQTT